MEKQLKTSLSLQNEVDTRWLEELDRRSQNQAETLFAFEEKCKQLYDERYKRYVSVNNKKMMSYQKQLTDTASSLSNEKSKYDSKLRRIKLGCLKWKTEYQRNISKKYEGALITLENRYSGEIERLLSELSEARAGVSKATRVLQENQTNYMSQRVNETNMNTLPSKTVTGQEATIAKANTATLCSDLLTSWEEQRVSTEERIAHMTQLLNEISITSEFVNKYQSVQSQVVGRMPIIELMSQKTYFEYAPSLFLLVGMTLFLYDDDDCTNTTVSLSPLSNHILPTLPSTPHSNHSSISPLHMHHHHMIGISSNRSISDPSLLPTRLSR